MRTLNHNLTWMSESLGSFIAELSLSKSKPTVEAYRYDVGKFLEYISDSKKVRRINAIKPVHIVDYLGQCKEAGKSEASINRYYMAVRAYCRYLRKTKACDIDLTQDLTAPRMNQKAPFVPSVEEVNKILEMPNTKTFSGMRDKAILELLYSSGLRASELCDLKLEDYRETCVIVKCGKRSKTRTVPLTSEASSTIKEYIDRFRGTKPGYLFETVMKKQLRRQLLCVVVKGYAQKAQIAEVTTHTFRHACATHLLDEGADLRLIQEVLGHSSIASTQRYTQLSSQKMEEMFNKFHPRKKEQQKEVSNV